MHIVPFHLILFFLFIICDWNRPNLLILMQEKIEKYIEMKLYFPLWLYEFKWNWVYTIKKKKKLSTILSIHNTVYWKWWLHMWCTTHYQWKLSTECQFICILCFDKIVFFSFYLIKCNATAESYTTKYLNMWWQSK